MSQKLESDTLPGEREKRQVKNKQAHKNRNQDSKHLGMQDPGPEKRE